MGTGSCALAWCDDLGPCDPVPEQAAWAARLPLLPGVSCPVPGWSSGSGRRTSRPFLEFTGLAHQAVAGNFRSSAAHASQRTIQASQRARQAIKLAERHGWSDKPDAGTACTVLAVVLAWQGRLDEADDWLHRAERTLRAEAEPAPPWLVIHLRGAIELVRGRNAEALTAFRAAEALAGRLAAPHTLIPRTRALRLLAPIRLGDIEHAERALAHLGDEDRGRGLMCAPMAALRLAQHDPRAAAAALMPVLDGSAPIDHLIWLAEIFVLEAIIRDALGEPDAADNALEHALDLAEPDGALEPFLLHPAPGQLERHARHGTAHAALIADIVSLLVGNRSAPLAAGPSPPLEPLSDSELRVLRYLPTNLSGPEIAGELFVSHNTVRTHITHLYAKLGAHTRAEAVTRARALGLLAPSPLRVRAARPG
jgi:LuxR family maltose regulon positive regulatory protein